MFRQAIRVVHTDIAISSANILGKVTALALGLLAMPGSPFVASAELVAQAQPANAASPALKKPGPGASRLLGTWRVVRGAVAPWVTDKSHHPDTSSWLGKTIQFEPTRVIGPDVLTCGTARYAATSVPAEGMFQGTFTKAATAEAMMVGVSKFPIAGTSLTCATGVFEFHFPDSTTALLAMSNAIWTLDRSPGARAAATAPDGVVQRFLEAHFARDMGFSKAALQPKAPFLTAGLTALTTRYFAVPANPNEAPDLNGDPFTNSQEYPTRFSVGTATTTATTANVRVRFSDALRVQTITYHLRRESGGWRIDDLRYEDGVTLRKQLGAAIPGARS